MHAKQLGQNQKCNIPLAGAVKHTGEYLEEDVRSNLQMSGVSTAESGQAAVTTLEAATLIVEQSLRTTRNS